MRVIVSIFIKLLLSYTEVKTPSALHPLSPVKFLDFNVWYRGSNKFEHFKIIY